MTTVAECASLEEAEILRSLLADCGVKAYLPEELTVPFRGIVSSIRVQVADEDAESARRILAAKKK
ncbi:MAG TPA: DUF2007 domain-containing protein [Opitutaceae bacterium]|nr:DUF2007 domain-containing protein [Opitutaceae bacterium]